jgi:hypothetical protein
VSVDGAVMRHLTQICERRASAATEAEAVRCSRPASADQANARKISSAEGPEMTECRPGAGGANETQITAKLLNAASLETRPTQRRPARSTGVPVAPASARSKHVRRTAPLLAHSVAPAVQLYSQDSVCRISSISHSTLNYCKHLQTFANFCKPQNLSFLNISGEHC